MFSLSDKHSRLASIKYTTKFLSLQDSKQYGILYINDFELLYVYNYIHISLDFIENF